MNYLSIKSEKKLCTIELYDVCLCNMSCSEVMYQAYYPYLYQRAGAAPPVSAHPVPRTGPFSSPFTATHQYERVS